jgi:hypothetical protein
MMLTKEFLIRGLGFGAQMTEEFKTKALGSLPIIG